MTAANIMKVRECSECGSLASTMDTLCKRCQQRGTLRDRYLCLTCERLLDEPSCTTCAEATAIRAGPAAPAPSAGEPALNWTPRSRDIRENAPPPWLAGGVGGAVLGVLIGAGATLFIGGSLWIGALVGLVPGALVGVGLGPASPPR